MTTNSTLSRRAFLRLGLASGAVAGIGLPLSAGTAFANSPHPLAASHDPSVLAAWMRQLYDLVRAERCSPTSAARIYGAVAVGAYEAVVPGMPSHLGLGGQLNGLSTSPSPSRNTRVHWPLAMNDAVERVALAVFVNRSDASRAAIAAYAADVRAELVFELPTDVAAASSRHGRAVGDHVSAWIGSDGYAEIQGLPYTPPEGPGLWRRTPPNHGAALEPHWGRVRPMALVTADACAPRPHVPFSTDVGSVFHAQAKAVHDESFRIGDAERDTAMYWRDNPDGTTGLPSGHWMLIAVGAAESRGFDLGRAAEALALTGISLADAFTSCWTEKYRSNLLRPVSYIQDHIDPAWSSFVNSPAFPEYTSGHSVGSGAAASTLMSLFGPISVVDDTGVPYGREVRSFRSFDEAAREAAVSRLYGGIHYPMAIDVGLEQGRAVAAKVGQRVSTRRGRR